MAAVTDAILGVFRERALGQAELAVLYVFALQAVVGVRSRAASLALLVAVAAGLLIDLVDAVN